MGDGICQHNSEGSNHSYDGDCDVFNAVYPECKVSDVTLIGDDHCHQEYNIPECKYDGGDCLLKENTVRLLLVDGNITGVDQYQQNTPRTQSSKWFHLQYLLLHPWQSYGLYDDRIVGFLSPLTGYCSDLL